MQNNLNDNPKTDKGEKTNGRFTGWMQNLLQIGLGDSLLHTITNIFSILAIIVVIWMAEVYFNQPRPQAQANNAPLLVPTPIAVSGIDSSGGPIDLSSVGIVREENIHTNIPTRPRQEIVQYTVQKGDTVSSIADNYGLQPKTIFAANYSVLQDDPESLKPGQTLKILPVNGVYWEWLGGIPFGQWAAYFNVKPEDIINYPANHLDPNAVGDPANANIKVNTWLIVPGGTYQYHTPGQIGWVSRTSPATAQVAGAGACPPTNSTAAGTGTFVYPTDRHYLSGFDYSTVTHHLAIDLAANLGDNIYAADGGVIVYAGWNSYGYGNMIMVDHGDGFQTLYAHLSQIFVSCGEAVTKSQVIAAAGATGNASGPHLHFEVRTSTTVIDPWNVLPPSSAAPWTSP
jgi:murein DD-endopeptidase MepM/ murein hydrolase activator NlpD